MNEQIVINDMRRSMAFVDKAKPILKRLFNGGEVMTVEGDDNQVCRMLDMTCGTDYFQIYSDKGLVWGVASRVQNIKDGCKPYNTFTVRKARESGAKTEYEKRQEAIKHGGLYPYLTMQGYVNTSDDILSIAIAKTTDIMEFVEKGLAYENHTRADKIGQAAFYVVDWRKFKTYGYKLIGWQR